MATARGVLQRARGVTSQIYYFDAALNSVRKNADGTAPRNAQALLFQMANPATTSCTGTGNDIASFCDDRLGCPTQMQ